jgi:TonB-dependent receptor
MKSKLFLFTFFISALTTFAQVGTIRGSIFDLNNAEAIQGVKVIAKGTTFITVTDIEGKFDLQCEPGTYTLHFKISSFQNDSLEGVEVRAGQITLIDGFGLEPKVQTTKDFVVKREQKRNTEGAMLSMKLKSPNMIDGISSAAFRNTGDNDAASAMRRVTGVSVADGKYVFIRGIGDRYNKTILNGMDIPGLDPDRNTLQMDIFPTNVIDNLIVNKTFVADLPADFSGGIIDIGLKSFSDKKVTSIFVSGGFNPNFHFNKDYLTYAGGKTDFLGFDDGAREIPAINNIPLFAQVVGNPSSTLGQRYQEILAAFNPNLAAYKQMSLMNGGLGFTIADQKKKENHTIGYQLAMNYSNNTEYYADVTYGRYGLSGDNTVTEMEQRVIQKGSLGSNNVLAALLGGLAIKGKQYKIQLNALHLQSGESSAGIFEYTSRDQGADFNSFQHNLSYSQKSLTNIQLSGLHQTEDSNWKIEWNVSPTHSAIKDPDNRITRYEYRGSGYAISTETGFPERIWRDLQENNLASKVDFERKIKVMGEDAKLKFGVANTYKSRDYIIRNFMINVRGNIPLTGDPNELFSPANLWPYNGDITTGVTYEAPFMPVNPNKFSSSINNTAAYTSLEFEITNRLKSIMGVRSEYYVHRYTGQDQLGQNKLVNEKVLENLGFFPSVNFVYSQTDEQNIRLSYSKTIARPSFKELSYAEIYDPLTGRTFIGGLFKDSLSPTQVYWDGNLVSTDIHNFDLRYEIMPKKGKTFSVSAFYKKFINPIEIIQYAVQDGSFQPRNVGDGQVIGGELEYRSDLKFISNKLKYFDIISNITIVDSKIELNAIEYETRVANARAGQIIDPYRKMAGQAPYVINAGLIYNPKKKEGFMDKFEMAVFYNVQGPTLYFVGNVDRPDVYTVPFHSVNLSINNKFGKDDQFDCSLRVNNLLNDATELVYHSFGAQDQFFTQLRPGVLTSLKITWNL